MDATLPGITLRDELEGCLIGAKKLRRDVADLAAAIAAEGIVFTESPALIEAADHYLSDLQKTLDALVPQVAAALAARFAEELPGYPEKDAP